MRQRLVLGAATAAAVAAAGVSVAQAGSPPKLVGTVGPGFTITLRTAKGKTVRTLRHGRYTFVIKDLSSIHNFAMERASSEGFDHTLSTVPARGTRSVTLTLTPGTYKFYCAPHESSMSGTFTVT